MPPVLESLASITSASGSTMASATASGCPFCRASSAAFLARLGRIRSVRSIKCPPPPLITCRTSPILAFLLNTMSRQASGNRAATPVARSSM